MAFTGGWLNRQFSVDPDQRLHTADNAHSQRGHAPDPNPTWELSIDPDQTPEYLQEYPDMDWLVADTPGIVLDATPSDHNIGSGTRALPDDVSSQTVAYAQSSVDYGADHKHTFNPPPFQDHTTRYLSARFEGVGSYGPSDEALKRGLNSLPENNPEGFRRGWVEQQFVDRKMYDPERVHDRRLVQPNVATVGTNQPVPADAGPYNSPFASLARILTSVNQRPMVRREPPPISESVVTDGTEDMYDATSGDWVAG